MKTAWPMRLVFLLLALSIPALAQFPAPDTYNNPWYTWCGPGPANRTVNLCAPPDGVAFNPNTQVIRLRITDTHWPVTYTLTVNGRQVFPHPQTIGNLDLVSGIVPLDPTVNGPQEVKYMFTDAAGSFFKTFFASFEETPCDMPTTDQTINICTLTEGQSMMSPVHLGYAINDQSGSPLYSLIYVDGIRYEIFNTGKNVNKTSQWLLLYPGKHRITVQAHPQGGIFYQKTVNITVTGPTDICKPDRSVDPGVTICSLRDGQTVSSPVRVQANAGQAVRFTQIYIDGKLQFTDRSADIDTSLRLAPGTHRLTVQAQDVELNTFKKTIFITVQ